MTGDDTLRFEVCIWETRDEAQLSMIREALLVFLIESCDVKILKLLALAMTVSTWFQNVSNILHPNVWALEGPNPCHT